jgi:hypothetical protein
LRFELAGERVANAAAAACDEDGFARGHDDCVSQSSVF